MATETSTTLPVGYMLQDFEVESVLGVGGFGITYCARDVHLNRHVAIKEYMPVGLATRGRDNVTVMPATEGHKDDFDWGLDRFRLEAETLVAFRHPNIVTVFRYFPANGTAYLVMEYQDGKTLGELIHPDRSLSEEEILEVIFPLLDGLEQVHKAGFMHRDIKPANIFIRRDGKPVLIDFGAARQAIAGHSQGLTSIVTAGYAPYEQYDSETEQGPWTDLYAIGATLYRCITGERPVEAPRRAGAVMRNNADPMKPAAEAARGEYSDRLLDAIDTSMAVLEQNRPQSVAELRGMLRGQPTAAPAPDETMIAGAAGPATVGASEPTPMAARTAAAVSDQKSGGGAGKWIALGLGLLVLVGGGGGAAVVIMNQENGENGQVADNHEKAWKQAQSANSIDAYRSFIAKFPNSRYVDRARAAMRKIQDGQKDPDDAAFAKAKAANTKDAYQAYLKAFPNGRHRDDAKKRLAILADDDAFAKAKAANTREAYQAYLKAFPNGRHRSEVEKLMASIGNPTTRPKDLATPIANTTGSLAARYSQVLGHWCSAEFEINLTRTQFMSRHRKASEFKPFPITKINFQKGMFRIYYLDRNSNQELSYEFAQDPNDAGRIHLRRILYKGAWRSISKHYTRKCG